MPTLKADTPAPAFTLSDAEGRNYSLSDALKNGPVLAAFFKISCPVCQFTFPFLQRIYEAYGNSQISIWGISQDNAADTRRFVNEFGVKFPALIDAQCYNVSNQYGLTNVPSIFLIQPDGKIQTASIGFTKRDLESISSEIAQASGKAAQPLFRPGEKVPDHRSG